MRSDSDNNGCTLTPFEFPDACREHDIDYATGRVSRREADLKFFNAIYPTSPAWAWIYWMAVRLGGAAQYRHEARTKPGRPSDQTRDV